MAYITADREALMSIFSNPGKFYNADLFTFHMASLLVFIFGAGVLSVDRLVLWKATSPTQAVPRNAPAKTATL